MPSAALEPPLLMRCSDAALLLLSSSMDAAAALFRPIIDLPDFFLPPLLRGKFWPVQGVYRVVVGR